MSAAEPDLGALARELESAAARLRDGTASPDEQSALVERCAELATRIASRLDERIRGLHAELPVDESPEQERLL